ncbi:replication-relaxation family protein [Kitasatospora sp. NPDC059327]|uniref:replication-relaxation family protein n=1 Tax=Kitasatospora sp. NPDC059327 TaxID=3346803 RepID=UPI0036742E08
MSHRQPAPGTPDDPPGPAPAAAPRKRVRRASKTNPGGSNNKVRADVQRAIAVLKIVTAHQLWRLLRPNALENKFARAALNDLEKKRITVKHGTGEDGRDIWGMTTAGRDAAKALFPDGRDMGGIARKAGASSAAGHALAVSETIISFVVGGTGPNIPDKQVNGDRTAPGVSPGFGRIDQWATEIEHLTPHKPTVRTDAVLQAPDHRIPVLLVEVDLDNESNPRVAKKLDDYRGFFEHTHSLPNPYPRGSIGYLEWGRRPEQREQHWRRTYPDTGRPGYPPVALALGHLGERAMRQRVQALTKMTRSHWQGQHLGDGFYDRTEAIPILFTSLEMLIERGPLAPIWRRAGRDGPLQPLHAALDDHDGPEAYAEHQNAQRAQATADAEAAERRRQQRELLATACPHCNRTADKYKNPRYASDGERLCHFCQQKADQAAQAEAAQQITQAAQAHIERAQTAQNATLRRTLFGPRKPKKETQDKKS